MDYLTFIDQLKPIGWATVAGMFVFFVLKPIIEHIIHKKEGALPPDLENRLVEIENHRFTEVGCRIDRLETKVEKLNDEIGKIRVDIAKIDGKIRIK